MKESIEIGGKSYKLRRWTGCRTFTLGNNACKCKELYIVEGYFCVCSYRTWCEAHGLHCVGTHD